MDNDSLQIGNLLDRIDDPKGRLRHLAIVGDTESLKFGWDWAFSPVNARRFDQRDQSGAFALS